MLVSLTLLCVAFQHLKSELYNLLITFINLYYFLKIIQYLLSLQIYFVIIYSVNDWSAPCELNNTLNGSFVCTLSQLVAIFTCGRAQPNRQCLMCKLTFKNFPEKNILTIMFCFLCFSYCINNSLLGRELSLISNVYLSCTYRQTLFQ